MNILDAVSKTNITLKKVASTKGGEYVGPCPACGGNDRFHVWPEERGGQGSYWCRGCGKGGDNVQFLVDFCGYDYKDAFRAAGREMAADYKPAGLRPVTQHKETEFEPINHIMPVETWQLKAEKFVDEAHKALLNSEKTLEYLEEKRGLDLTAVKLFKLGWFAGENNKNCMYRSRESWGLSTKLKPDNKKSKLWIPRGLVIPCFSKNRVARIRIRRPKTDLQTKKDGKYYIMPGSSMSNLVLSSQKDNTRGWIIVEAELDAMLIARQVGSLAGVVALGSSSTKPTANIFYYLKKAVRVLVSLDYDKAGCNAFKWWDENFDNVKEWPVPVGKDPGEAFASGVNIKEWVLAGLPPAIIFSRYDKMLNIPQGLSHLKELRWFLQTYPITIIADEKRNDILFDAGLQNQTIKKRVKQLFFEDEEVFYYLKIYHPDFEIRGENFDFKTI